MEIDVLDMSNRELTKVLIDKTNQLVKDRNDLLQMQRELMKAKIELKALDAGFMKDITLDKRFSNAEARNSQLALKQNASTEYKQ